MYKDAEDGEQAEKPAMLKIKKIEVHLLSSVKVHAVSESIPLYRWKDKVLIPYSSRKDANACVQQLHCIRIQLYLPQQACSIHPVTWLKDAHTTLAGDVCSLLRRRSYNR